MFFVEESLYIAITTLTKIAFLCFCLRIFPNIWFRYSVIGIMIWVASSGIVFLLLQIFQCKPVEYIWEGWKGTIEDYQCLDINMLAFANAGFGIAQDVVILALPIPLLTTLRVSWHSKLGIISMFSLGVFVLITSCIRLRSIVVFARSTNPSWDYSDVLIWTGLECAVSMIVTSLPAIRVLINTPKVHAYVNKLWPRMVEVKDMECSQRNVGPRRSAQSRIFSMMAKAPLDECDSGQLELCDKPRGLVQTNAVPGHSERDSGDFESRSPTPTSAEGPAQESVSWLDLSTV